VKGRKRTKGIKVNIMKFDEPTLKKVRRGGGYRIESFAVFAPDEKTVWFCFEGFRESLSIELEDLGKAKDVWKFFNALFNECTVREPLPLRKQRPSILDAGYFYATWTFHVEKLPKLLDTIEESMGKAWRNAFSSVLRGREGMNLANRPDI